MTQRTVIAAALAAALGLAAGAAQAQGQGPIKIGSFLAVTGGASFLGDPEAKTLRLYVERINKSGGVLGRQLQLIVHDSAGDAKQAATFAKRLIEDDKVDILIGGSTTGETMAIVKMVDEAELPFLSLGGASVIVEPVKERKWVFKTPHSDRLAVQKVYVDMKARGLTAVAIIAGSGGFDQSCRKNAQELAPTMGMRVVADETYAPTDTDVTPQLTKIKNAAGVQAVLGCGFGGITSITAKNYKQLAMTQPFYFNHGVGSKQFITGAAGGAEGIRLPAAALLVAADLPDSDPQKKPALEYAAAYKAAFNEDISTFGGHALDALLIAVDAFKRAGSTDKKKVRDAIESTKGLIGVDGIFTFSAADHNGLDEASFKMVVVQNGEFRLLK
ncbi:MAG: ABC transporter substrate-binding protein [Alphaproteobacteria bacterium]|nr:ABC transporter substrate-binding protein [Alphaproteobacteria bacterium]